MDEPAILIDNADGIARITLNRPASLNSFTAAMHRELREALDNIADDCRVIILTGAGRAFCAGQDLGERSVAAGSSPVDLGETVDACWNPLIRRLAAMKQPVIARVNGVAAGAGVSIALACDIVVAAKAAKFVQSFSAIGLVPDSGGSWILPRLVGQARALGLALTGEPLPAQQAADWGLIWKCVDDEQLDVEVNALATRLAALPPLGLSATKALIRSTWGRTLDQELDVERDEMRRLGFTDDYREGVAAFIEKRKPRFTGS
ncbi:2-(1,2-epoxy-1,2-dihydrophenyl)acetyl-CoA isomerase [Sphingomonas sinipercae]|uniref:2-(1,2-epoxy-1,2-dihydrophenyl)acetyl-CoA isomerase n=1 Tax=Sphingomonas sinipercae TaxID=2714944 RepID=A0A6G7ZPC3_9SPHN|nr:2-(1,2-epoxy-1,2-dihydrophenyl)acetyl-CoA isomerase PaaG [Sphingomonas sinipercae]QIL02750.1 2-(1,2-epoxy-1,2-dihydrophenyl)acetyl-CoA isomerase [Sphingomonas sinipercae]